MGYFEGLVAFSKTGKGVLYGLIILAILFYAIFWGINSHIGDKQNELIDLKDSKVPSPSDIDKLCGMPDKSEPCPELGKSKVR